MPVDYYPQKTVAQLTVILQRLQDRQVQGGITEVSAAGVRTSRKIGGDGDARTETEIRRVLYSLYLRSQGTDQAADWPNPYGERIRKTRARYVYS